VCGRELGDIQLDEPKSEFSLLLEEQDGHVDFRERGWRDGC
jgi:hypothetical protein